MRDPKSCSLCSPTLIGGGRKKTAETRRQNLEVIRSAVSAACGYRRVAPRRGERKNHHRQVKVRIGGVIGGFLFGLLGVVAGGLIGSIVTATAGAVVLLFLARLLKKA